MEIKSGIYQWRNIKNGKLYIGSAVDLLKRKNRHLKELRQNIHYNQPLQNTFNKNGESVLEWSVLEFIPRLKNETNKQLKKRLVNGQEQHYLDTLLFASENNNNKFDKLGYNILRKADSPLGIKRPQEVIEKMKIKSRQTRLKNNTLKQSKEHVEKRVKSLRGKKKTPDQMKKSIESNKRRRIRNKELGIVFNHTQETKENIRLARTGTTRSEKTKAKMRLRWERAKESGSIEITKQKMRQKAAIRVANRPLLTCEHCGYQGKNKGSMSRVHFDNCKSKPLTA